ncbi:hypothetical protein IMG5_060860 [Ichthyophthirius multifiliis]|uniref:Cullin family profile domain-containing protein n=1 Tax=Ichthyophthirius multifiliis TaxID=5932 RepID=G0QNQ6_ICHMU|nr:hypothetical protein IMG5_060860 [Ichthyophthirius multifiliis]EGR33136.1 hypothetical protein IMG5_060860 [Ichthyophthirius multifiliis]|eukprot:XP_004037122.1 hypothetical protein IMG5_060860 [Ichthyophthirius multifiliis]
MEIEQVKLIEDVCDNDFSELLYQNLQQFYSNKFNQDLKNFETYIQINIFIFQINQTNKRNDKLLDQMENQWIKIKNSLFILSEIFKQFECQYLYKSKNPQFELILLQSLQFQLNNNFVNLKHILIQKMLEYMFLLRENKQINEQQLFNLMNMIIKVNIYNQDFKDVFLQQSNEYYQNLSKQQETNFNLPKYLCEIEYRLKLENNLIEKYLSKSTSKQLIEITEKNLITNNLQLIFENGFNNIIQDKDYESLSRLFIFINRIDKVDFLKKSWNSYIKNQGIIIINNENQVEIVVQLINLSQYLDTIVSKCFDNREVLRTSKIYALEYILSLKTNTLAELTSKYIDSKLKKDNKTIQNYDQIEKEVNDVFELFRYLPAKDVFEAFYNKRLARRLLQNQSYSNDLEKHVIERLKQECGEQYTIKAEEILKDVNNSKSLNKEFQDFLQTKYTELNQKIGFQISVLSSASWPIKNTPLPQLPQPFSYFQNEFKIFYLLKHKGVFLNWQHETSNCEISGIYGQMKYTFQVHVMQALILLSFNENSHLTLANILALIPINKDELKKTLVSLYNLKHTQKLLNKTGEPNQIEDNDVFEINESYKNKKKVVKVCAIFQKETSEDSKETTEKVITERGYILDASIVKILKNKKSILHNELMKELFEDIMLPINANEVKKRIEGLIEREYIKRDQNNHQIQMNLTQQKHKILEFYRDKTIFITGVTGFLGKVIFEKIMRALPQVKQVIVLIRNQKNITVQERFKKEIIDSEIFSLLRKQKGSQFYNHINEKTQVVQGDLFQDNIGLSQNDYNYIINKVNIIINCASSIDFNAKLIDAININIQGTLRIFELAKKCNNLCNFVHISTCYVNSDKEGYIEEKIYKCSQQENPIEFLNQLTNMPPLELEFQTKSILGSYPNTYVFTKSLTERILQFNKPDNMSLTIIRPAIIGAAVEQPVKGWVQGVTTASAVFLLCGIGIIKHLNANPDNIADVIPVDCVSDTIIVSGALCAGSQNLRIFNNGISYKNPINWELTRQQCTIYWQNNPYAKQISPVNVKLIKNERILSALQVKRRIHAYGFKQIANIFGNDQMKKNAERFLKMVHKAQNFSDIFKPFFLREFIFESKKVDELLGQMSDLEKNIFYLDISKIDMESYFTMFNWGIHKFILNQQIEAPFSDEFTDVLQVPQYSNRGRKYNKRNDFQFQNAVYKGYGMVFIENIQQYI